MLFALAAASVAWAASTNFRAHLSGAKEVPPAGVVNVSLAQGQAIFQLSDDGSEVYYKILVANLDNAFMAHIHKAAAGANGPIAVWLYPGTAPAPGPLGQGRTDGVLVEGTFTAENLVNQAATGITTLPELLAQIREGNAYVNIHTNDGVPPTNTGPGDYPGGEVRGQIH
jgi:hypothetical protein